MGYSKKNNTTITLLLILIIVLGFFCLLLSNNHITYRKNYIIDNENNEIISNINDIKTDVKILPSTKIIIGSLLITTISLVTLIIISMKKNKDEIKKDKEINFIKLNKTNKYIKNNLIARFEETEIILNNAIKISNIDLISNSNYKNIRVIIQYKTCIDDTGNKIKIKDNIYDIVERGIVIKNSSSISKLEANSSSSDVFTISTKKDFNKYWEMDNNFNIKCSYTLNNLVQDQIIKAFVCIKVDNIKYTIYSEPISTIFFIK